MEPVTIPGVPTVHQRTDWQDPNLPVTGPTAPTTAAIEDAVAHWPGTTDVPDSDYRGHVYVNPADFHNDLYGYLRRMQRDYVVNRGYSVGYCFLIDYLGGVSVGRGFDIRNAANSGSLVPGNWNHRSVSAQFITDIDQPPTPQQEYAFAMWVGECRRRGMTATIRPHLYGEATACPGTVMPALAAGRLEPDYWHTNGPPPGMEAAYNEAFGTEETPMTDEQFGALLAAITDLNHPQPRRYIAKAPGKPWLLVDGAHVREVIPTDIDENDAELGGAATVPPGRDITVAQWDDLNPTAGLLETLADIEATQIDVLGSLSDVHDTLNAVLAKLNEPNG